MRVRLLAFAFTAAACALYLSFAIDVRTSIVDFLPDDEQAPLLRLARDLSSAPQSRAVTLTLSAENDKDHREAAKALARVLDANEQVRWARGGFSSRDQEALYDLLFPARFGLVDLAEGPIPTAQLEERVRALKARLGSPLGALARELAPRDPLGLFDEIVAKRAGSQGQLTLEDGQLTTKDGRWSVLFAELSAPAFDAEAQRRFAELLSNELARLRATYPTLELQWTSVARFAEAAERSIRADIERISIWSMIGIMALYLAVFRSLRQPLLVVLPLAFGSLVAVAVCQLLFGFVHGLSLAFGSAIIGVAEDFPTHYFIHHREAQASEDNETLMKRLWPAMLLGGTTTIVGVLSLLFSGFPGLVQMAVFGGVGVLGALLCTRYVLPQLTGRPRGLNPPAHALLSLLAFLSRYRRAATAFLLVPACLLFLGWGDLQFQDGVSALRTRTEALDAENARVQARLGRGQSAGTLVVALGDSDEQALLRVEQLEERLASLPAGVVGAHRSVAELLPSVATQEARRARLSGDATLAPRLREVLRAEGFVPEAFAPFFEELLEAGQPIEPRSLLAGELADLIAPFRLQLADKVAYLTPLSVRQSARLAAALSGLQGVFFIDQEALFSAAYGRFRDRSLQLLLWGMVLVFATLWLRYRSAALSLLGVLPAVLGAGSALGALGLLGVPISFMNVVALLLVLSMGVDYGIYGIESRNDANEAATTLRSVLLASLTTVLSFGLLSVSDNPALSSIGLTVSLGLVFSVLATPLVLALAGKKA